MSGADDVRNKLIGRLTDGDHIHLRARNHDVPHLHFRDLQHALNHRQRLGVDQFIFVGGIEELEQLLAVFRGA